MKLSSVTALSPTTAEGGDQQPEAVRPRNGSLKPVIDVIPASAYENPTWRGLAYFARDLAMYAALVTGLILVSNVWEVLALEVATSVVVAGLFVVGHDAAHGALFRSRRANSIVGHLAMLPSWHVYEGWILGHNRVHHGFTVRQGYDFVWHPTTPEEFAAMSRLTRAIHRFEWSWAGAGVYYLHQVWWKKMIIAPSPGRWVKAIRRDKLVVLAFVLAASGLLGWLGAVTTGTVGGSVWLVARVVLLPFLGFSYLIGSFVHVHHVHPDIKWWKKADWSKFKAQMEGTTVLEGGRVFNFFFHWIMVHVPHHVDVRIPMYNLELAASAIEEAFPGTVHRAPMRFRDFVANSRQCKLYDFEAGKWMTYREAASALSGL